MLWRIRVNRPHNGARESQKSVGAHQQRRARTIRPRGPAPAFCHQVRTTQQTAHI